jgi:transcription elongation GreA/GreB family factor
VGQGLLGKSVGDEVTVRRPKGGIDYEIVTVEYESPSDTP